MRIAISFREKKMPTPSEFDRLIYFLDEYYKMAVEYDVELVGIVVGKDCDEICSVCDGLILPGSATATDPKYFGGKPMDPPQVRDEYAADAKLIDAFVRQGKPIFGICAGLQRLNIFFGGSIARINHPPHQNQEKYHTVTLEQDSFVYDVFGAEEADVNSHHYFAIDKLAPNFRVVARSKADNVIEAIEDRARNIFATQWHPEQAFRTGNEAEKRLFQNFFACCQSVKEQR